MKTLINIISKINWIFSKKQKVRLMIVSIITFIGSFAELLGVAIIMPFVSVLTDTSVIHTNSLYSKIYKAFGMDKDVQFIALLAGALIFIYVFKNLYLIAMYDIQNRFLFNNKCRLTTRLVDCYMKQNYLFHVARSVAELMRNVVTDVSMYFGAVQAIVNLFTEGSVCILLAIYLLTLDTAISVGVIILMLVFALVFLKKVKKQSFKYGNLIRDTSNESNKWIKQSFEGIKDIKIAGKEKFFLENVNKYGLIAADVNRKHNLVNVIPRPVFEAVSVSSLLFVITLRIVNGVDIKYFVPILSGFAIAAFRLLPSFSRLTGFINELVYNKSAIDAIYNDLKEADELMKNSESITADVKILPFNDKLRVNEVSFKYPGTDKYILKDACLTIEKNQSVAFIGASGAGKTTLADIIIGLLETEKGTITVDGVDIQSNLNGWHRNIGYIPQFIYLMDGTIKENVLFGLPESENTDELVWKALEKAQLKEFVETLKLGFNTSIGDRGVRLSGGQRQRIGIARALYNNPDILVLDEATSALDNETEKAVMEAIHGLRGEKTMLIIAHRYSTIEECDIVYEIKEGQIVISRGKN